MYDKIHYKKKKKSLSKHTNKVKLKKKNHQFQLWGQTRAFIIYWLSGKLEFYSILSGVTSQFVSILNVKKKEKNQKISALLLYYM